MDTLSIKVDRLARVEGEGGLFIRIVVRGVETVHACDEALRVIDRYEAPGFPCVDVSPASSTGIACTEAPRGILYHRYRLDGAGNILDAKIVPPTSQNLRTIENDLARSIGRLPRSVVVYGIEGRSFEPGARLSPDVEVSVEEVVGLILRECCAQDAV